MLRVSWMIFIIKDFRPGFSLHLECIDVVPNLQFSIKKMAIFQTSINPKTIDSKPCFPITK